MQNKIRLPILKKVSNTLKASFFIAKMRRPIIAKLILINKSRKQLKRFKLFKHYNYGFLEEYQFSASSTPLIRYRRRQFIKRKRSFHQSISSMLALRGCFGGCRADSDHAVSAADYDDDRLHSSWALGTVPAVGEPFDSAEDEEDSVDQRAEKFIQWFYQEMRLQRENSS